MKTGSQQRIGLQVAHAQQRSVISRFAFRFVGDRRQVSGARACHLVDEFAGAGLCNLVRVDDAAIAHDRHALGDAKKLLQAVRHHQQGTATRPQTLDDRIEQLGFGLIQRGGRLVHDVDERLLVIRADERAGNFDQHGIARAEQRSALMQVDVVDAQPPHGFSRQPVQRRPIDKSAADAGQRIIEKEVLRHAERRHDRQFLVDEAQAQPPRRRRVGNRHARAIQSHFQRIGRFQTSQQLDERGFARAIFADQPQRLAAMQVQRRINQRRYARISFAGMADLQVHGVTPPPAPPRQDGEGSQCLPPPDPSGGPRGVKPHPDTAGDRGGWISPSSRLGLSDALAHNG